MCHGHSTHLLRYFFDWAQLVSSIRSARAAPRDAAHALYARHLRAIPARACRTGLRRLFGRGKIGHEGARRCPGARDPGKVRCSILESSSYLEESAKTLRDTILGSSTGLRRLDSAAGPGPRRSDYLALWTWVTWPTGPRDGRAGHDCCVGCDRRACRYRRARCARRAAPRRRRGAAHFGCGRGKVGQEGAPGHGPR